MLEWGSYETFLAIRPVLSNIWIKICGITRREDASVAAELGVDAIGLNFYASSPRVVKLEQCSEILADFPKSTKVVALFVNPDAEEVQRVINSKLVDLLQFHGEETEIFCNSFDLPYMKAFRIDSDSESNRQDKQAELLSAVKRYNSAEYILLDSFDKNVHGGSGKVFDWSYAEFLNENAGAKLILAGGLSLGNVASAISAVRPFGVDVSSGVEVTPGIKDVEKMKTFVEGARSVRS